MLINLTYPTSSLEVVVCEHALQSIEIACSSQLSGRAVTGVPLPLGLVWARTMEALLLSGKCDTAKLADLKAFLKEHKLSQQGEKVSTPNRIATLLDCIWLQPDLVKRAKTFVDLRSYPVDGKHAADLKAGGYRPTGNTVRVAD